MRCAMWRNYLELFHILELKNLNLDFGFNEIDIDIYISNKNFINMYIEFSKCNILL